MRSVWSRSVLHNVQKTFNFLTWKIWNSWIRLDSIYRCKIEIYWIFEENRCTITYQAVGHVLGHVERVRMNVAETCPITCNVSQNVSGSQDTFKRVHPSIDFGVDTLNMSRNLSRNMPSIVRGLLGHVLNVSGIFWTRSNVSNGPDTFKRVQNVSKSCPTFVMSKSVKKIKFYHKFMKNNYKRTLLHSIRNGTRLFPARSGLPWSIRALQVRMWHKESEKPTDVRPRFQVAMTLTVVRWHSR